MDDAASIAMLQLLSGYWFSQALYVVAELGIADHLRDGAKTAEQLAPLVHADPDALYRLLRALSSAGIFTMGPDGFAQNEMSDTLRADREDSVRPMAMLGGHPLHWKAWGELLESVRTGKPAFEIAHHRSFFDALAHAPAFAQQFQEVLGRTSTTHGELISAMGLHRFRSIVDVGGGTGTFARAIARTLSGVRVVVFDRPDVVAPARDQVETIAGDFFDQIPPCADAYVLKFVLHDWSDADAARILSRCRDALSTRGRLFVVEVFVPEDATPSIAKTHDINMLVLTGGRERTLAQYESLVRDVSLDVVSTSATPSGLGILEVRRASPGDP